MIQKDNVKALFRRGQARMHLENLDGSQDGEMSSTTCVYLTLPKDCIKICDEPSNWSPTIRPSKRNFKRSKDSRLSIQNGPNLFDLCHPYQNHVPVVSP